MQLCRVLGEVWGSRVHPAIEGCKILRVSPYAIESGKLKLTNQEILAYDMLDASVGENVLISSSSGVRNMVLNNTLPLKTITVAVVDNMELSC